MKAMYIVGVFLISLAIGGYSWWSISEESSQIHGDFSRDKVSDLAIGVPEETVPETYPYTEYAGAIHVLYGKAGSGLVSDGDQYLYEGKTNVTGGLEANDHFGTALTIGDFNCDGAADLAVGVPGQEVGGQDGAGAVHIFYGYYFGLIYQTPLDDFTIDQSFPCMTSSSPELDDRFGQALAAGDFNGDGCSDLAIGVPGEDWSTTIHEAGIVHVVYGTTSGFDTATCTNYNQSVLQETIENSDHFGAALAAGNFGTDAYDDLAIGAPDETFEKPDCNSSMVGVVHVVYGESSGLGYSNQIWYQDEADLEGFSEPLDRFGAALAAGNFDRAGGDDLAIGVPGQDVGIYDQAGAVHILYSSIYSLLALDDLVLDQNSITLFPNDPQPKDNEQFGAALATGDFDGDLYSDLAIGIPGDHFGIATVKTCGAVNLFYGGLGGLQIAGAQEWSQNDGNVLDTCEDNDKFGAALAAGNFNHDSHSDLAVGVPGEDYNTGVVQVLYGTSEGITAAGNQLWSQDTDWIEGVAEPADFFGSALAAIPALNFQVYLPVVRK